MFSWVLWALWAVVGLVGLLGLSVLGSGCYGVPSWANSGHFLATQSDPAEFDDRQVCESLEVISNECVDFDDPKEFDDFQIFDDPKGISIGSMDFDNPKVYDDTSIFDGLVFRSVRTF